MIKKFKKLFDLISLNGFSFTLILCLVAAIFEGYSVFHLGKYIGFVLEFDETGAGNWYEIHFLKQINNELGEFFLTVFTITIIIITSSVSALSVFKITRFASFTGIKVSNDIVTNLITTPLVHQKLTKERLSSTISFEVERFTLQVLLPIFQLFSKGAALVTITLVILIQFPMQSISIITVLATYYVAIYMFLRPKLEKHGVNISKFLEKRIGLLSAIYANYRILYSRNRFGLLSSEFEKLGSKQATAQAQIQFLSQVSRYVLEILIFGVVVIYLSVGVTDHDANMPHFLATIGFAAFKLFPTMQSLFTNITTIRGNYESIERIWGFRDLLSTEKRTAVFESLSVACDYSLVTEIQRGWVNTAVQYDHAKIYFQRGKLYAITGVSGVGKSTLLDLMSGYLTSEHVTLRKANSARISYLSQTNEVIPFGLFENVALDVPSDDAKEEAVTLLEALGLSVSHPISDGLSGGQLQRLGIARVLVNSPEILLLDEPTSALDRDNINRVKDLLLHRLQQGATIIIVTHQDQIMPLADYIVNLERENDKVQIDVKEVLR